jgi:hypothetical protein
MTTEQWLRRDLEGSGRCFDMRYPGNFRKDWGKPRTTQVCTHIDVLCSLNSSGTEHEKQQRKLLVTWAQIKETAVDRISPDDGSEQRRARLVVEGDDDRRCLQRQLAVVRRVVTPATSASECERLRLRTAGRRSGHTDTWTVCLVTWYWALWITGFADFVHRLVF